MLDSAIMSTGKSPVKFLWITVLVFSTLACRAATRLVLPETPTPLPTASTTATPTLTPSPTFTPTIIFEAACSPLLADILNSVTGEVNLLDRRSDQKLTEDNSMFLVEYEVAEDKISGPHIESVPDELEDERDDRAAHEAIWDYFVSIIPAEERQLVTEFSIFTDGRGNHLAAVSPVFTDPEQWRLQVDILDSENYYELTYTLIHEQGHLLTLNSEQVPPGDANYKFPEDQTVYQQEDDACAQYFTGEGCSEPDSYINQFFTRFWPYLYAEWDQIEREDDEDTRASLLEDFYKMYEDQFLTDYAPTSPAEDIAESWAFFVLSPKPELNSIANEKVLFFYEYPELVELRTQILKRLCVEFPR